jgi:hypothetical protein
MSLIDTYLLAKIEANTRPPMRHAWKVNLAGILIGISGYFFWFRMPWVGLTLIATVVLLWVSRSMAISREDQLNDQTTADPLPKPHDIVFGLILCAVLVGAQAIFLNFSKLGA